MLIGLFLTLLVVGQAFYFPLECCFEMSFHVIQILSGHLEDCSVSMAFPEYPHIYILFLGLCKSSPIYTIKLAMHLETTSKYQTTGMDVRVWSGEGELNADG